MDEINLKNYINDLASNKPAPGGGSASALFAVLGCSLSSMVCALTLGKKKYEKYEKEISLLHKQVLNLKIKFEKLMQDDIDAFNQISSVYKMPSQTSKQKTIRHKKIQENLPKCIEVPFEIMQFSAEGINLSQKMIGKTNKLAISDIGCAVMGFKASLKSAWLNVLINLKSFDKAPKDIENKAKKILKEYIKKADEIYNLVEKEM